MQYRRPMSSNLVLTLYWAVLVGVSGISSAAEPSPISHASSCMPGSQPGTRCCSPEVPPKWWCAGSVEVLGACDLPGSHEGRLLKCSPLDAKRLGARKSVEE